MVLINSRYFSTMPRPARPVAKTPGWYSDVHRLQNERNKISLDLVTIANKSRVVAGRKVKVERKLADVTLTLDSLCESPHVDSDSVTSVRPEMKDGIGAPSTYLVPFYLILIVGISLGLFILIIVITTVVVKARRRAKKLRSDADGVKSGGRVNETKVEYKVEIKVRILSNNLEKIIKFSTLAERKKADGQQ